MKNYWIVSLAILTIVPILLAVFYAPIDIDSGYFLSVIERMSDGFVPYIDFQFGYTPLVVYMGLILKRIFSIGINYEFFLIVHFTFQIITAFLVYKITTLIIIRKDYGFYSAIMFLMASHWNGGNAFLFETPSILWGLLALYLTLRNKHKTFYFIVIGFIASLSYLSKQYGLGFFFLITYLIAFNSKRWKQFVFLVIGFILPVIVCNIIWGQAFIPVLIGGTSYSWHGSWLSKANRLIDRMFYFFYRIFPVLIISVFYIPTLFRKRKGIFFSQLSMLVFGIFGFMAQFLFAGFSHYYLYIIPFASILSFIILDQINSTKWPYITIMCLTLGLSLYSTFFNRVYKIYLHSDDKKNQYQLAYKISQLIGDEKNLYIINMGLIPQYYLTNTIPPNLSTIGYNFGKSLTFEKNLKQVNSAAYILKYKMEFSDYTNAAEINAELRKFEKIDINRDVILYRSFK